MYISFYKKSTIAYCLKSDENTLSHRIFLHK
jgi:hypothetical protein